MDARAEALAQSRPTTDSPSKTTRTRVATTRTPGTRGGRRTSTADPATGSGAAPATRRGRPAASAPAARGSAATPAPAARGRRGPGSGGTRVRTPRKSS